MDVSSPVVFMSLCHCHHRKHASTRGRRQGNGARGGGGGNSGWKDGRGGGRTRTTAGKTKKCQQREGTPSDDSPDDPFTVGDLLHDLTGSRDDLPGGATGGGEDDHRGGGKRAMIGGGGGVRPPLAVETTRQTPHPSRRRCCCRCRHRHLPSWRRTSQPQRRPR